jgi:homoserine kinase
VKLIDKPGVHLSKITGDGGALPLDPSKNTAGVSVLKLLEALKTKQGVEIEVHKNMPLGSGLGSSAASAAASVFAINVLLDSPFSTTELVSFAMQAEKVACGSAHADNVAPALFGGFTLIRSYEPLDIVEIPIKKELYCTILHPKIEIRTETARAILKKDLSLKQHVMQSANAAGLIAGLIKGDYALIGRSLHDVVAEPVRSTLIPGFSKIKTAALNAGALGCSLSGSGPSLFALSQDKILADIIGLAMQKACLDNKLACDLYVSSINRQGPRIL